MSSDLVTLVWWPHSGGRWLSRSILKQHSLIDQQTFVHPWIFNSSDDEMTNDLTAQVHKARSLPELKFHLDNLYESTKIGRVAGLRNYYRNFQTKNNELRNLVLGESCLGSPNPRHIDLESIYEAYPNMKMIHLIRNPIDSFSSFESRHEMDGDPAKIAGSWVALNSKIRLFFNESFSNQYLLVRYEDLLFKADNQVKKICDFLEIDFDPAMTNSLDERWGRKSEKIISERQKQIIYSVAGSEMKNYSYNLQS